MKHPVLVNKVRLIVWWLVWLFLALGQSLLFYYAYGSYTYIGIVDSILSLIIYSGIAISLWYPFSFFNTGEIRPATLISNLVMIGAISITLWVFITKYTVLLVLPEQNNYTAYWEATFPYRIGTGVFIYGLIVLTYFLFVSLTNLSEKNAKEARLESLVKETELKMLRSQINPHFLFNSLNGLITIVEDNKPGVEYIQNLSDLLRYMLKSGEKELVLLRDEIAIMNSYISLQRMRFRGILEIKVDVPESYYHYALPPLVLQMLVENCLKHNIISKENPLRVNIIAEKDAITVVNNLQIKTGVDSTGQGLKNIAGRYRFFTSRKVEIIETRDTFKVIIPLLEVEL
jgi:sensor histidine kinase YesM